MAWLDNFTFTFLIIACLTLGLAPFYPEPHLWHKIKLLMDGNLRRPLDIFDMFMHGAPWIVLVLKTVRQLFLSK